MTIDRIALLGIDVIVNAQRARTALRSISVSLDRVNDPLAKLTAALGAFGVAFSGFLLARRIGTIAVAVVQDLTMSAAKLEQQIYDIETIAQTGQLGRLTEEFKNLGVEIKGVDFQEISDVMGSAARAGVRLDDGLMDLTKTAIRFSQVAGDITPREATEGLAALLTNFDMGMDKADNLASGINALSDNFLVTSGEILKTSARLSGFARTTNMSIENLNALSAALLSTKISATVVRTSVSKLIIALASEPEKAARLLQLTNQEFEEFFQTIRTKPEEAIKIFTRALMKLDATEQTKTLQELGIASSRVRSVIEVLKGAIDNIEKAQKISAEETRKGTANLDKYGVASQTAAANLQNLENRLIKLKTQLFETDEVIVQLTGGMKSLEVLFARFGKTTGGSFIDEISTDLGGDLGSLNTQRRALETYKDVIKAAHEARRPGRFRVEDLFSPTTAGLEIGRAVRETLGYTVSMNRALGQVELINQRISLIDEKRAALQEQNKDTLKEQIELREKEKALAIEARHEFFERQRELSRTTARSFRNIAVSPEMRLKVSLETELSKLKDAFAEIVRPTKEVTVAFEEAKNRLEEQIRNIPLKKLQEDLGQFTGNFGNVIEESQKLLALMQNPDIDNKTRNALGTIFDQSFMEAEKQRQVLTLNAFRSNVRLSSDNPERKLMEAQLTVAKTMVDLMVKDAGDRKRILEKLDKVVENTKNSGKIK